MKAGPCSSDNFARALAEVVGQLDAASPCRLKPSEIILALQRAGHLPIELPPDNEHEKRFLTMINLMPEILSDSKRRCYQLRKISADSEPVLSVAFLRMGS